jgi:hypothetical protein
MKLTSLRAFPFLHETQTRLYKVSAGAAISTSQIELRYRIEGTTPEAFSAIVIPEVSPKPKRTDELWKTTCFECFIPGHETDAYLEFNGSPSGDWNWYGFQSYRSGMKPITASARLEPKAVSMSKSDRDLEVTWILPMSGVLQGFNVHGESVQSVDPFGLTVVLHTQLATLYWALNHDGVKPDFHQRASFIYDPVRN